MPSLKSDFNEILQLSEKYEWPFNDFQIDCDDDNTILFEVCISLTEKRLFTFVTFEYPYSTSITDLQSNEVVTGDYCLKNALRLVATNFNLTVPTLFSDNISCDVPPGEGTSGIGSCDFEESDDDIEELESSQPFYFDDTIPGELESGDAIDQMFLRDKQNFNDIFGDDSLSFSYLVGLPNFKSIRMRLDDRKFTELHENYQVSRAFGFGANDMLVIDFEEVPAAGYRNAALTQEFNVTVTTWTADESRHFVVGGQLARIVKSFMSKHWQAIEQGAGDFTASDNIWLDVAFELQRRLFTLNEFCIICDKPNDANFILPTICSNELCIFAYEGLGVMMDVRAWCLKMDTVVDLLLLLAAAAVRSPRAKIIFDPYPSIVDPAQVTVLYLNPEKRNEEMVKRLLHKVPCMQKMFTFAQVHPKWPSGLQEENVDPLVFPLVRWVIASNRTFLQKLTPDQCLPFMNTKHQFLMLLDSPAKEKKFAEAKRKFGKSKFLFHGSPLENWHSILRKGLMNASGSKYQMNGAAYGKGIYLSATSAVSAGYAAGRNAGIGQYGVNPESCLHDDCVGPTPQYLKNSPSTVSLIAICEVVESDSFRDTHSSNPLAKLAKNARYSICVEENPDHVSTRFMFAYCGEQLPADIDLTQDVNIRALQEAIRKCHAESFT